MFLRNGSMSSSESGPPCASSSTPRISFCVSYAILLSLRRLSLSRRSRAMRAHHLNHCQHVFNGRLRQHAVPQVEDVAGAACCLFEDALDALAQLVLRTKQQRGVEI